MPVRIGIGARDIENGVVEIARRDTKEKVSISIDQAVDHTMQLMEDIQKNLFQRAKELRERNTHIVDTWDEFVKILDEKPGFIYAHKGNDTLYSIGCSRRKWKMYFNWKSIDEKSFIC